MGKFSYFLELSILCQGIYLKEDQSQAPRNVRPKITWFKCGAEKGNEDEEVCL
jgi:hypothetical protein